MRFKDKVIVIIGGNSGIGLAAAEQFVGEGAQVTITGRDERTLDAAKTKLGPSLAIRSDLSDLSSLDAVMASVRDHYGHIDVLFVNAGISMVAPVKELTAQVWDQVQNVNLRGCFFAAQKALPLMRRGGSIVFSGSISSVLAGSGQSAYAAAKAGLRAAARILGLELIQEGIRVNVVSPGPTETPMISRIAGLPESATQTVRPQMIAAVPMHRMGRPEEIARAVLFLASDDASFISGIDLYVDGGCVEL